MMPALRSGSLGPMDWEVWERPISTGQQQPSAPVARRGDRQARPRPQGMHVCWNVSISARICKRQEWFSVRRSEEGTTEESN